MTQLEVNFTIKGEKSETTFTLVCREGKYYLMGVSAISGKKEFELKRDDTTMIFHLVIQDAFEESAEVIESRMIGLAEEWIDVQSQGLETDGEDEPIDKKPGYGPQDIFVEPKNFSLTQLIQMVNDGDIEIAPRFQRHFIWDRTRKSRLIESIFLGLPLPAIYLSQYDDGRLTIVDGLQRISTIKEFLEDGFSLCNMEYFEFCNGKNFSELNLPGLQLRRFKQTQITCFVIDYRSPSQLKYDLFRRLNTGGKVLNDQEIRNCLSRSGLQETLHSMITSSEFKQATGGRVKDTRMAAQESALRFIYFYNQYSDDFPIGEYDGDMSGALDSCVEDLNSYTKQALNKYVDLYKNSMRLAYKLFGDYAFRKVGVDYMERRKNSVNKSLMLVISVLLAVHGDKYVIDGNLTSRLADLLNKDSQLNEAISWSTSSKKNISYVFKYLKDNLFDKYLLKI